MDNRFLWVQQGVDTTFVIQVEDEGGSLLTTGWQDDARAEVHFRRPDGEFVGKLSSDLGHIRFVPASPGVEEAMHLTFKNTVTQAWQLKPVLTAVELEDLPPDTKIRFDENSSQVELGVEIIYGTLLVRDASDMDIPKASGGNLAVVMEESTTREFIRGSVGGDFEDNDEA